MAGLSDVLTWEKQQELVVLPGLSQVRPLRDTEKERTTETASAPWRRVGWPENVDIP